MLKYAVSCTLDLLSYYAPVIFRGTLETVLDSAVSSGYDAVEFHLKDPARFNPIKIREEADARNLQFGAICTGMEYHDNKLCLISEDTSVRKSAVNRLKEYVDFCEVLDAMLVVGTMRGNIPDLTRCDYYLERLTSAVLELSDYAAKSGVQLIIENINRYVSNYMLTIEDTANYVRKLGRDNVKLHLDTHSMNIEEKVMRGQISSCLDILGYVHFADSNRAYPGGGGIDFKPLVRELCESGWDGIVAMECQPLPDPETCARNAIAYCKAMETIVRIEREPLMNATSKILSA